MHYFIGWDVGGWNCDSNANSRDAIVILNAEQQLVGQAWRGNLRTTINESSGSLEFINNLFKLCAASEFVTAKDQIVLAIDIPLGFSEELTRLITGQGTVDSIEGSAENPYLFRQTERFLFKNGLKPLSSIKDMIGSQTTKGMHVLAKFFNAHQEIGVWHSEQGFQAIEAYPSACKYSPTVVSSLQAYLSLPATQNQKNRKYELQPINAWKNADEFDALLCAKLAWLFVNNQSSLSLPNKSVSMREGWIFVPKDSLQS